MIVTNITDARLLRALLDAAHPEEEVVSDRDLVIEAVELGYPRLFVDFGGGAESLGAPQRGVPVVRIDQADIVRWDAARRTGAKRASTSLTERVRDLVEQRAENVSWVDRAMADLTRAAGAPLPVALRAFARRVLEFPSHYDDLHPLADMCGTSRGALKARFRRRGLPSPYAYLRWLRILACANALSDPTLTVAQAAHRLGFTSDGNLCRAMGGLTGLTPTEVRSPQGRNRLLRSFAWAHLQPEALEAWKDLEDLFLRTVA